MDGIWMVYGLYIETEYLSMEYHPLAIHMDDINIVFRPMKGGEWMSKILFLTGVGAQQHCDPTP